MYTRFSKVALIEKAAHRPGVDPLGGLGAAGRGPFFAKVADRLGLQATGLMKW